MKKASDPELYRVWLALKENMKEKAKSGRTGFEDRSFSYNLPDNVEYEDLIYYAEFIDEQFFKDNKNLLFIYDIGTHSINIIWK